MGFGVESMKRQESPETHVCIKTNTGPREPVLPVSINWPTNYNFALFSKLPTNYTKISEK